MIRGHEGELKKGFGEFDFLFENGDGWLRGCGEGFLREEIFVGFNGFEEG